MISMIRAEIKDRFKECSTLYKEIDRPFLLDEDITEDKIKYKYHVEMGQSLNIVEGSGESMDQISATLSMFCQGGRKKLEDFDGAYSDALLIKELLLDITKIINKDYIKAVVATTVIPGEVLDSQDIYSFKTEFVYTISYGLGE